MSKSSMKVLAEAYDMEIFEVKRIVKLYPDNYYEELEAFIQNRSRRN